MIEQDIFKALSDHAGLSAIVGDRVYPLVHPQGATFPTVTFQRVSTDPVNDMGGYSGLENLRLQVDVWAESYLEARAVASEVKAAMSAATAFSSVRATDRDLYEASTEIHHVMLDFSVWTN